MVLRSHPSLDYRRRLAIFIFICFVSVSSTACYKVTVSVEEPFLQRSTAKFDYCGVETIDEIPLRIHSTYKTNFGHGANSSIQGTYYDINVMDRDEYGGAGEIGRYLSCPFQLPYRLVLSRFGQKGINYFGLWISAMDPQSRLEFYSNGINIFVWTTRYFLDRSRNNSYYGNPTFNPRVDMEEQFAFINFYFDDVLLNEIRFSQGVDGPKFESDNHLVGYYKLLKGAVISTTTIATTATITRPPGGLSALEVFEVVTACLFLTVVIAFAGYTAFRGSTPLPPPSFEGHFELGEEHARERESKVDFGEEFV